MKDSSASKQASRKEISWDGRARKRSGFLMDRDEFQSHPPHPRNLVGKTTGLIQESRVQIRLNSLG